ncbi:MAG: bifunctional glutamate N-acetyltransferase/amino-acid acetyltransferase ArgJ [Thermodesulfobacteriota bacterium]
MAKIKDYNPQEYQVPGFSAAAIQAGIRGKERLDMGLIYSHGPTTTAAGVFTRSLVKAAPVLLDMEHLRGGTGRAILVNSGIANACTGPAGMEMARYAAGLTAAELGLAVNEIQICSTGVIGEPLEKEWFAHGIPALKESLSPDGLVAVARAMMTTDTHAKMVRRQVTVAGKEVTIVGLAKGSGMIMPNMATMLSFVMTDAAIASPLLQELLSEAVDHSFNVITVDGDTSTNDTVLLLAGGAAGNVPLASREEAGGFASALNELLHELALMIVADGEGATKLITVEVAGATSRAAGLQVARTIANSPLFKTACFGEDANWGRILAAAGRAGVEFEPEKCDIFFDGVQMVAAGLGLFSNEEAASKVLQKKSFTVRLDLHCGPATAQVYTCDLSHDYVSINGDYRS